MSAMKSVAVSQPVRPRMPGYAQLLLFFFPLAVSSSLMTLEPLIINSAISRGPSAELQLAAFNVMFAVALVIEAPVLMLLSVSTALAQTQASVRRLLQFTVVLAGTVVTIGLVISLTPLYGWLLVDLMNIPPEVAAAARPAQAIMALWPLPIAWRRTLQGVLIAHDRTPVVTAATVARILALAVTLAVGSAIAPNRMLTISAIAMQIAVLAESLVITGPALAVVRQLPSSAGEPVFSWRWLAGYYQPLAVMTLMRQVSRPLMNAGIAAALLPQRSLAAWSIAWSFSMLPFGVTLGLEQVAIAKGRTPPSLAQVRRFVWGTGLFLSALLVLVAYTPLVHPTLRVLFNMPADIEPMVVVALRWTAALPLIQSLQALWRGTAIGQERTQDARTAMLIALGGVALVVLVGPRVGSLSGVAIGSIATMLSALVEAVWLAWREQRANRSGRLAKSLAT
jgi:Na+-driven multidrug efflux pump